MLLFIYERLWQTFFDSFPALRMREESILHIDSIQMDPNTLSKHKVELLKMRKLSGHDFEPAPVQTSDKDEIL